MAESASPALNTQIESGNFDDEKVTHREAQQPTIKPKAEDEEEDEDIDALIEDLESQDGHGADDDEDEEATPGGGRVVPEDMLQTDTRIGLTEHEVIARRRKYGVCSTPQSSLT